MWSLILCCNYVNINNILILCCPSQGTIRAYKTKRGGLPICLRFQFPGGMFLFSVTVLYCNLSVYNLPKQHNLGLYKSPCCAIERQAAARVMLDAGPAAASSSSRCQAASAHIRGRPLQTTPTKSVIVCKTTASSCYKTCMGYSRRQEDDGWMRMSVRWWANYTPDVKTPNSRDGKSSVPIVNYNVSTREIILKQESK